MWEKRHRLLIASSTLVATPAAVLAQQPVKVWRIGFLSDDFAESGAGKQAQRDFPESLRRLCCVVGRDVVIEWRWGERQGSKLTALAEDLVRLKVDLIGARTRPPIAATM